MKTKLLSYLSLAGKALSLLAGLSAYMGYLPSKYMPIAGIAFAVISSTKDFVIHLQSDFNQ